MIGNTFPDGVTPDYVCEAKAQKDPTNAQVTINTDVDMDIQHQKAIWSN